MEKLEKRISDLEKNLFIIKTIFSFAEACLFLNLSKSYVYKLTSLGLIPHYKPQGKMLYFEKSELEEWMKQNHVKTKQQHENEAEKNLADAMLKK